jgi:anti-anti-sigma factor
LTAADRPHPTPRVVERMVGLRRVIAFVGELDLATAPMLADAVDRAAGDGMAEIWVDLRPTSFMDVIGVHCLVDGRARTAGRRFAVICNAAPLRRLLALTGADAHLDLFRDSAAANRAA